jgi:hypothetical protein
MDPAQMDPAAVLEAIQRGEVRDDAGAQSALSSLMHGLQSGSLQFDDHDPMAEYNGDGPDIPF